MNALSLILFFAVSMFASGQQKSPTRAELIKELKETRIPLLNIEKGSFEEALKIITDEWKKQQPDIAFPVATVDYLITDEMRKDALISVKAEDIPFVTALKYLSEATRRRLRFQDSGLITMEMALWLEEDQYPETHRTDAKLLEALNLNANSTPAEVAAVYQRFGLKLEAARMVDGGIEFLGLPQEHEQVAGINHLLRNGFKITKE